MRISAGVNTLGGEVVSHRPTRCRWLLPLLIGATCALQGCDNRPAPSPTPNPHPQHTLKLKITVEQGSEVNRVEVKSLWVVTNLGCAPVIWPAGNRRVKQVDVPEEVKEIGNDEYVATIVLDRFQPDSCRWDGEAVSVDFYHNNYLVSGTAVGSDVLRGQKISQVTCLTSPPMTVGVCAPGEESYYKGEDKTAFNATMELMK